MVIGVLRSPDPRGNHHDVEAVIDVADDAGGGPPPIDDANADLRALRGATVEVDPRRVARSVAVSCLIALLVATVALTVAGVRKNDQVTELRDHSVGVAVTVTTCRGLLGGSGSNPVGYTCKGTYLVGGHRYDQTLPTNVLYAPGTRVALVVAADDPDLLSTRELVAAERPSWLVYRVPAVLFVVLVVALVVLARRRRRASTSSPLTS
jgi:hypothetical protein